MSIEVMKQALETLDVLWADEKLKEKNGHQYMGKKSDVYMNQYATRRTDDKLLNQLDGAN